MHCEIVVPGLLSLKTLARYPSVETLLARGRRRDHAAVSLEKWLLNAFQVTTDGMPAGALTVLAAGGDPGDASWMRADPVHLRLMRDRLVVMPPEALEIPHAEADALAEALNRHFAASVEIKVVDARRWCARIGQELPLTDGPALESAGRGAALARESGPLLTEIQMLLHAHPVNDAREARGDPAINSLWLWGAGRLPNVQSSWTSVLADEPIALGLARLVRARYGTLPASATPWLERASEDGRHLVVLDSLRAPAALEDFASYKEKLDSLETAWFAPLLGALRAGRLGMVTVHVPDAASSFEAARGDLRRFWRRPKALESHA